MSSDNQVSNAALAANAQESSITSTAQSDQSDKVYKVAVLLIVALVYMVYISPMMRARSLTEKTPAMKATFRWVDLLTKLVLVYLLAYAATCNMTISVVITLVFLLFTMQESSAVVIETNKSKKNKMVENMTGDEEDLDEGEDIDSDVEADDSDFEFERVNDDFVYDSDTPVLFPLNNGSMDESMADNVGDLYDQPQRVNGLIVDTVAESERIANAQGLGMDVLDRPTNGSMVHNVQGASLEDMSDVMNIQQGYEGYHNVNDGESNRGCGCGSNNGNDAEDAGDEDGAKEAPIPKEVSDVIDENVEVVAQEVKAEKSAEGENVEVPTEAKEEVRRAARFVAHQMSENGEVVTRHDLLMICRMVYGQMFRCEGIMKTVVADVESKKDSN